MSVTGNDGVVIDVIRDLSTDNSLNSFDANVVLNWLQCTVQQISQSHQL